MLEIVDRPACITPNANKNQVQEISVSSKLQLNTVVLKSGVDFAVVELSTDVFYLFLVVTRSDTVTGFLGVEVSPAREHVPQFVPIQLP